MKKEIYGIGRSRDRKGKVVDQHVIPYTMCIHTSVGGGRGNMAVLVLEKIDYEKNDGRTD